MIVDENFGIDRDMQDRINKILDEMQPIQAISFLSAITGREEGKVRFTGLECHIEEVQKEGTYEELVMSDEWRRHFNDLWSDEYYYDLADFMKKVDPQQCYHSIKVSTKTYTENVLVITKQPDTIEYTDGLKQDERVIIGSGFELSNNIVTPGAISLTVGLHIPNDVWLPVFWRDYMTYTE